jgi:hypothetical protein
MRSTKPALKTNTEQHGAPAEGKEEIFRMLLETVSGNIPPGFEERVRNGAASWVVPHKIFPAGYHCDPNTPLPFASLVIQKDFVALYHMGIYSSTELLAWFVKEYALQCKRKPDMGKSCIRFKKAAQVPIGLIGMLMKKMTVKQWINVYETALNTPRKR